MRAGRSNRPPGRIKRMRRRTGISQAASHLGTGSNFVSNSGSGFDTEDGRAQIKAHASATAQGGHATAHAVGVSQVVDTAGSAHNVLLNNGLITASATAKAFGHEAKAEATGVFQRASGDSASNLAFNEGTILG